MKEHKDEEQKQTRDIWHNRRLASWKPCFASVWGCGAPPATRPVPKATQRSRAPPTRPPTSGMLMGSTR